ncbi:MAG: hypothetical protein GY811_13840 [Myxococcales bacterium]|nr:hypothetical protein [Myxococcales bacterium]
MNPSNTAFAGILLRVSALPALRIAMPAVLIVAVAGGGLYGDTTLTFSELGVLFDQNAWLRATVFTLWVLVMAPAARAGLLSEGIDYLRWLPLPRHLAVSHLLGLLVLLHALPALPFFAAGLPAHGIGMLAALVGVATSLLPGARGAVDQASRVVGVVGLLGLLWLDLWGPAIAAGIVVAVLRGSRVWRLAPEHSFWRGSTRMVWGGAWCSMASAQALLTWRTEAAALSRALLVSALGVFLITLVLRANQGSISESALLVTSTPPIAAVSLMLALVLKRSRARVDWLMRSLGVSRRRERICSFVLLLGATSILAALCLYVSSGAPAQIATMGVHTAAWALLTLGISSRSEQDVRSASITLALTVLAVFAIGIGGHAPLGAELGLGLLAGGRALLEDGTDA